MGHRFEGSGHLGSAVLGEVFVGLGVQASTAAEQVVLVARVLERFVVDSAAGLVEVLVGELAGIERVSDLGRVE